MENKKVDIRPYTKQFYKGNGLSFSVSLIQTIFESIGALILAWLIKMLLDLIGGVDTGFTLFQLLIISALTCAGFAFFSALAYHSRPKFIARGMSQYKEFVFSQITKKSVSAFSGESTATYISALTNDLATIEKGYLVNIFTIINQLLTFVGALALMIYYSPLLTLIAFLLALVPLTATIFTGGSVAKAEERVSKLNEGYTSTINDNLGGFSVIKSFKAELQALRNFKQNIQKIEKAQTFKEKMLVLVQALGTIAGVIAQLGVFIVGAYFSISGEVVTAGVTMLFVQLMNYVLSPIGTIPTALAERQAAKALVLKVATSLEENTRKDEDGQSVKLEKGIEIKDLSFAYEPEKLALSEINYNFELGKKYALVGASGSGKSTLLNILMSSYHDYEGQILYDGVELRQISSQSLYDIQSIIQQSVFVFNSSIKDNITMFSEFPADQIERAINLSGLKTLIDEKGEDYLCGENGNALSGGEKQRISIARSLLKKSQVLLVDEATAALDKETAQQVSTAILDLNGVTEIVVTHALEESLLKKYDSILTMKNGKIVESGTFDQLIEQKGYFYSLFTISQ